MSAWAWLIVTGISIGVLGVWVVMFYATGGDDEPGQHRKP